MDNLEIMRLLSRMIDNTRYIKRRSIIIDKNMH